MLDAAEVRRQLIAAEIRPPAFRELLSGVAPAERDNWLDRLLGIDQIATDGPELPRGCTPYLPCSVDSLLRSVELAQIRSTDVVVDIGAGVGRAGMLIRLLTGAAVIGIEIQPALADDARESARRLNLSRFSVITGDAAMLTRYIPIGSVFFLYCPFGGQRLAAVMQSIRDIAISRPVRVCAVDMPLPEQPWLRRVEHAHSNIVVCESTYPCVTAHANQARANQARATLRAC